ncbi:MAG: dihydrodipicolinate synthase family protein [Blastocatellia bacterium]
MSLNLNGVFAAMPTPFNHEGEVAYDKLLENMRYWNQTDLHGLVLLGSTGEFPHLSEAEKLKLMETVRSEMPAEKMLLTGTSELSTRQTIEMTRQAASHGADAALIVTPFYYRKLLPDEQLAVHYQRVADASPIPILIYLIPQFTGVYMRPEVIAALAAHENIIGLKESSGDMQALNDLFRELGSREFNVMVGSPVIMHQALSGGAAGAILAVGAVAPRACTALMKAYKWGETERATALQARLAALAKVVGVPGIGHLKTAMDFTGLYGFLPRSPLPVPSDEEREQIRQAIADSGFYEQREDGVWAEKVDVD